jgi:hypothetical protein
MRILISSTNYFWNISHSKKKWATYDQKYILVFMYSNRYSCQILKELEFSRQFFFSKNAKIPYVMKILPVGAELFHADRQADGRTDMKLTSAFRNFAKAPNKTRQSQKYFNNASLLSVPHVSALIIMRHQVQTHIREYRTLTYETLWF